MKSKPSQAGGIEMCPLGTANPRILEKLGFQTGTLVELRPKNDNQLPNLCFSTTVTEMFSK
jgi:hypothetical protein